MLSNAYFLANFRFDTAESEPAKNLKIFAKLLILLTCRTHRPKARARGCCLWNLPCLGRPDEAEGSDDDWNGLDADASTTAGPAASASLDRTVSDSGHIFRKCIFRKCIFRKFCKFLAGSFSAVSKRNFATKSAFDSIFQALQDLHPFAPLQSQSFRKNRFEKSTIYVKIQQQILQML